MNTKQLGTQNHKYRYSMLRTPTKNKVRLFVRWCQ